MVRSTKGVARVASWFAVALLVTACGDNDELPTRASVEPSDAGVSTDASLPEPDAAVSIEVAPSGTAVSPALTKMSSTQFRLETSMSFGLASGTSSASEKHELRGAALTGR